MSHDASNDEHKILLYDGQFKFLLGSIKFHSLFVKFFVSTDRDWKL